MTERSEYDREQMRKQMQEHYITSMSELARDGGVRAGDGTVVFRELAVAEWLGVEHEQLRHLIVVNQSELKRHGPLYFGDHDELYLTFSHVDRVCMESDTPRAMIVKQMIAVTLASVREMMIELRKLGFPEGQVMPSVARLSARPEQTEHSVNPNGGT